MKSCVNQVRFTLACAVALAISMSSYAADSTLKVSSKVSPTCDIQTNNISFGGYIGGAGDVFASGDVRLKCSKGLALEVGLSYIGSLSTHVSNVKYSVRENGKNYARHMEQGGEYLFYNLFQDAAFTKVFGGANWFTLTSGARPKLTATGDTQVVPIYGAMAGGQYVRPGSYSDTVVAYVSF